MQQQKASACPSVDEPTPVPLPNYVAYDHPSTKWLLNTFRNGANNRLIAMMKEKPQLFRSIFQIYDSPSEVLADPSDTQCMFSRTAVLYLRPLSLAVYMRCKSAVKILLGSTLCDPMEYSYASDVFVQLMDSPGGDLLEILPVCIAIRRQFLDALPLLFRPSPTATLPVYSPRTSFSVRYVNRRIQKTTLYTDVFHYSTELAQNSRHVNIVKVLDVLISRCAGFYSPGRLDTNKTAQPCSLFRRLAHLGFYVDTECRIAYPLIQCMDMLIRRSHFKPSCNETQTHSTKSTGSTVLSLSFKDVRQIWAYLDDWTKDCYISVALLFSFYATLHQRAKFPTVVHAGNVLLHALTETNLLDSVLALPLPQLAASLKFILENDEAAAVEFGKVKTRFFAQNPGLHIERGDAQSFVDCSGVQSTHDLPTLSADLLAQIVETLRSQSKLTSVRKSRLTNILGVNNLSYNHIYLPKYRMPFLRIGAFHMVRSGHRESRGQPSLFPSMDQVLQQSKSSNTLLQSSSNSRPSRSASSRRPGFERYNTQSAVPATPSDRRRRSCVVRVGSTASAYRSISTSDSHVQVTPATFDMCDMRSTEVESYGMRTPFNQFAPRGTNLPQTKLTDSYKPCIESLAAYCATDSMEEVTRDPVQQHEVTGCAHDCAIVETRKSHCEKSCQVKTSDCWRAVNALIVRKPSVETLNLQDVDHLIDCITASALACENGLDSQLIEELFTDTLDQHFLVSRTASRTSSVIGMQICRDPDEEVSATNLEPWAFTAEPAVVAPEGEYVTNAHHIQLKGIPTLDVRQNISLAVSKNRNKIDSDSPTRPTPAMCKSGVQDFSDEPIDNPHNSFWSCAKSISQLNNAFCVFKQHMSASKRSSTRQSRKDSPKSESSFCV